MSDQRICRLCKREVRQITKHHLIPKTTHKNKWFRKNYTKQQMHQTVNLCRACHREIHKQISEKELGRRYNTLEKIQTHEKIQRFVKWISSKKE